MSISNDAWSNAKDSDEEIDTVTPVSDIKSKMPILVITTSAVDKSTPVSVATSAVVKKKKDCELCYGQPYKIAMCRRGNDCRYGDSCCYRHEGEKRGCPECMCVECHGDITYKTIECMYNVRCNNGSRCTFMHNSSDRGCRTCGDNKYTQGSSAASVRSSAAPVRAPVLPVRSPAAPLLVRSSWGSGPSSPSPASALPVRSPASALPVRSPASALPVCSPASALPVCSPPVLSYTAQSVMMYLVNKKIKVVIDGVVHPIYTEVDKILVDAPGIDVFIVGYLRGITIPDLSGLYERVESMFKEFPIE